MSGPLPARVPFELKRCSCGVVMEMRRHERTGFVAPINPAPSPDLAGNIAVNADGTYRVVAVRSVEQVQLGPAGRALLRLNHFVTCPDRERYRQRMGGVSSPRHADGLTSPGGER